MLLMGDGLVIREGFGVLGGVWIYIYYIFELLNGLDYLLLP